jgi:hypothetical protein
MVEFHKGHPNTQVSWERHMRTIDGAIVRVVEDDRDLPADDSIITVSRTLSLNTSNAAQVITDLFVGRITPGRKPGKSK